MQNEYQMDILKACGGYPCAEKYKKTDKDRMIKINEKHTWGFA